MSLLPKLRAPIDIKFETIEGQSVLLLRCPLGISKTPLALVPAVAPVVACFDGRNTVDQILQKFSAHGLNSELLNGLINLLDQSLFLETPAFIKAQEDHRKAFALSEVREPFLAGLNYSANANDLAGEVSSFLAQANQKAATTTASLVGLVAPHIDYGRGAKSYAEAYRQLAFRDHDLYLLFGTSHQYSRYLFHLTAKHFNTPLGILNTDRALVNRLAQLYGFERSFADEILHKREHSLELQTPFLKHLKANATIVPILVGGFHKFLGTSSRPEDFGEYEDFVCALVECLSEASQLSRRVLFLGGLDMAHVGKFFGDSVELTPDFMTQVEQRDRAYLDCITSGDKRKLYEHIASDGDARKICGFPSLYLMIDLYARLGVSYTTEIFDYSQAVDLRSQCAVTFAAIGMFSRSS